MARQCMRPGCDRPVAASLTYDTQAVAVWLDRSEDAGELAQHVCSVHAATLTAPLGWTVTDRRLVAVAPADDSAPAPPAAPDPVLEADESDAPEASTATASPEDPDLLRGRPKGKLLDRAFEWTGPQHSVLTTGSPSGSPPAEDDTE